MLLSLGAALLFSAGSLHAQSADDIVKKHTDAVGGAAAWKKVNSIRMTGTANMGGMDIPVSISKLRNAGMRQDIEIQGTKNYTIITPEKGWLFFPLQGMTEPVDLPAEGLKSAQTQTFVGDLIVEMNDRGYKFESAGLSTLDGKPVTPGKGTTVDDQYYRVKALDKDGNATDLFIDMKTYYLVKSSHMIANEGKETEAAFSFANYQKLPEGIVVPMSITQMQGELKVSKVEVNPTLEPSLFKP
jgi:hypothetical protein